MLVSHLLCQSYYVLSCIEAVKIRKKWISVLEDIAVNPHYHYLYMVLEILRPISSESLIIEIQQFTQSDSHYWCLIMRNNPAIIKKVASGCNWALMIILNCIWFSQSEQHIGAITPRKERKIGVGSFFFALYGLFWNPFCNPLESLMYRIKH